MPWHGRATPICALGVEKSETETQRTLCLEVLVGLAPHEEELGKNEYTVVNILHTHALPNPDVDGGLTLDSILRAHSSC